ncbi:hypothetical protein IQ241_16915 [Romeria aff. gracilis LEGE 07310]|uniref:Uncharacterized protein n=1 Tax=Vasconcelosia minhoensis LEGE 07310 TaxID=915328 RepID=A0A8J7AA48_9CYAN|nr:hypothetical protein [Romeria gracilis]MBE9078955.1 hypothetical protein [Romeria aff. gracilis LEGE 07310]
MKRFLLTGLTVLLSSLTISSVAYAGQTHLNDLAADLNGDGDVSLTELNIYNRNQRNPK